MANVLPRDLTETPGGIVNPNAAAIVDDGSGVWKATPEQIVDAGAPVNSQAEAEAGVVDTGRMTPLRVSQAIDALGVSQSVLASSSGGGMVGWSPPGAQATDTTVDADLLSRPIQITQYGVTVGDDISAALGDAIDDAQGREIVIRGRGDWYLDSQIARSDGVPINIRCEDGARLIKRHDDGYAISVFSPYQDIVTIASAVSRGDTTVTVSDGSTYAAGDYCRLVSADRLLGSRPAPGGGLDYRRGEFVKIAAVSGNDLTFEWPVLGNYSTTIRLGRYQSTFFSIKGGTFEAEAGHEGDPWTTGMIRCSGYPVVDVDTKVLRCYSFATVVLGAVHGRWYAVVDNLSNDTGNDQYGYGIQPTGCSGVDFYVNAGDCRHGFTTGQQAVTDSNTDLSLFGPVRGGSARGTGYGNMESLIDTHHGSEDMLILPSIMTGRSANGIAYSIRGFNHTIVSPVARNPRQGVYVFSESTLDPSDRTRGIRVVNADITGCKSSTIDDSFALQVIRAECTIVGGKYSSEAFTTIRVDTGGTLNVEGVVDVIPGTAESSSDRVIDCSAATAINGPGRFNIDATASDVTALGTGSIVYIPSVPFDGVDINYKSPSAKPTNVFGGASAGPVRNCNVKVTPNTTVGLGAPMGVNSTCLGMNAANVSANSLSSNLTLTQFASRVYTFATPITAGRTVTMPSGTGQIDGDRWRFVRTTACTGAFDITISDGSTVYTLAEPSGSNRWVDVMWSAAANDWVVIGAGTF